MLIVDCLNAEFKHTKRITRKVHNMQTIYKSNNRRTMSLICMMLVHSCSSIVCRVTRVRNTHAISAFRTHGRQQNDWTSCWRHLDHSTQCYPSQCRLQCAAYSARVSVLLSLSYGKWPHHRSPLPLPPPHRISIVRALLCVCTRRTECNTNTKCSSIEFLENPHVQ